MARSISTKSALRQLWFQVHLWLGVALCLLVVPVCVTGSYEVWQEEIDHLAQPQRYATTPGPALGPSAYLAAAAAAFGERAKPSAVRMPESAGGPVMVTGMIVRAPGEGQGGAAPQRRASLTAWLDPSTARVLDVANTSTSFRQTMHRLHGSLLIPGVGRKVVGWLGWALFASCLSGIWLWWPRSGSVLKGFRFKRAPDLLTNLHYFTGFWIAIPLAVLALTGVFISFPQTTRAVLAPIAPLSPQAQRPGGGPGGGGAPAEDAQLSADAAQRLAQSAVPGAEVVSLNVPTGGRGERSWRVQLRPETGLPLTVTVADQTGVIALQPQRAPLAGDTALRWNRRLHDGEGTGLVWRIIITVAGLIPALLAVTGVIVWAQRQLRKMAVRRRLADDAVGETASQAGE